MVKNNAYVHMKKICLPPCFGKKITADGRGTCPSFPTAPNRPPGTFRGEKAPQAPPPAGTPGRSSGSSGRWRVPLGPFLPALLWQPRRQPGRYSQAREERSEQSAGRREPRSAQAAPSLPPRSCAAPAGPARRRAGRGGASAGREGSRDRPWEGPLSRWLSTESQKPEAGRDL